MIEFHLCITKRALIDHIQQHGTQGVMNNWKSTDTDAVAAILAYPQDTFVIDSSCDYQKDGRCLGHEYEICEPCGGTGKVDCLACDGKGKHYRTNAPINNVTLIVMDEEERKNHV
jgi:hypothetical protein